MLIFRDVFLEADCFDDDYFAIFEDVDLGWRLWLMGYRVVMAPESFVYHRGHSTLDRQKAGKKRFLMHRNALMTIIKNYDDENLKKILPLAFILAVKRALLFMDIKKESFYFWKEDDLNVHMPPNLEEGCIHLAALDDVMENFVSIKRRREAVQAKRKRADREIFRLFKDPFRNLMGYKEYLWEEVSLFGHFSFEELFACEKEYENRLNEGIYHAEKTLGNLRKKIRKERWNIPVNVNNPNRIGQISDKFFRSFVQQGLGATLGKVSNHLVALMRKM